MENRRPDAIWILMLTSGNLKFLEILEPETYPRDTMNDYMNDVAEEIFSSFESGKRTSGKTQPERFSWICAGTFD